MKVRTIFNYNPEDITYEINDEPSLTTSTFYESLGAKLARYTSSGFPKVDDLQYSEELDIDDEPGFDIADYDIVACQDTLKASRKKKVIKNESVESVETSISNNNPSDTNELSSSTSSDDA